MMVTMQQSMTQLHLSMKAKEQQRELERAEEKAARVEREFQDLSTALTAYHPELPLTLHTDAFKRGIGATLSQIINKEE